MVRYKNIILYLLILPCIFSFAQNQQEQSTHSRKLAFHIDYTFTPIPAEFFNKEFFYDNFVTGLDISKKISHKTYVGVSFYHLWLVLEGNNILKYTQPFFISNLSFRYDLNQTNVKPFVIGLLGVGNLCPCKYFNSPNRFLANELNRLDKAGYYLGTGIGLDYKISNFLIFKPSVRTFYLLNSADGKRLHTRPFVTFEILRRKKNPPTIFNPRL